MRARCTTLWVTLRVVIWDLSALFKQIPFVTRSDAKRCFYSRAETVDNTMVVVFHHHSPVWVHHSPVWERNPPLHPLHPLHPCSSNGTSKHLNLITKAAARDHNKSKKQWGNSPTFDLFLPYETSQEESKLSDVAHMNPLFRSPAPFLPLRALVTFNCSRPCDGGAATWSQSRQLDHIWVDPLEDTARSGRQRL